jgi:hypothetical protein
MDMEKVPTDTLQYVLAIINAVKDSPLGMLALACLIVGFLFYVSSVYAQGFSKLSFLAYVLTLAFFVLIVFAVFRTSGVAKMIYYAGTSGNAFNVGRFTRLSDQRWEDSKIVSANSPDAGYKYHFVNPKYDAESKTLTLEADPSERHGSIEIDFVTSTIWWTDSVHGRVKLYQIVATM